MSADQMGCHEARRKRGSACCSQQGREAAGAGESRKQRAAAAAAAEAAKAAGQPAVEEDEADLVYDDYEPLQLLQQQGRPSRAFATFDAALDEFYSKVPAPATALPASPSRRPPQACTAPYLRGTSADDLLF